VKICVSQRSLDSLPGFSGKGRWISPEWESVGSELVGPNGCQPFERKLHRLGHRIASGAEHVVFCHLHNEASGGCESYREPHAWRDEVGQERLPEGCLRILEICLPKRAPLCHQWVFADDAIHECIDATTLAFHSLKEGLRLFEPLWFHITPALLLLVSPDLSEHDPRLTLPA
jgi:hypothetical protein